MKILEDVGNKASKHDTKNRYWQMNNIEVERVPLPVADYVLVDEAVQDVLDRKAKRGVKIKKIDLLGSYKVAVDSKKDMSEIAGNICGGQDEHRRFRDECILAQRNGIEFHVLIENTDGIKQVEDVFKWVNPRSRIMIADETRAIGWYPSGAPKYARKKKYPKATRGKTLASSMITMSKKYGVIWDFCTPKESGKKIIEILTGGENHD